MSELFMAQPEIFDRTFSGMAAVGESTGNMDEMFESIASFYEEQMEEVHWTIDRFTWAGNDCIYGRLPSVLFFSAMYQPYDEYGAGIINTLYCLDSY